MRYGNTHFHSLEPITEENILELLAFFRTHFEPHRILNFRHEYCDSKSPKFRFSEPVKTNSSWVDGSPYQFLLTKKGDKMLSGNDVWSRSAFSFSLAGSLNIIEAARENADLTEKPDKTHFRSMHAQIVDSDGPLRIEIMAMAGAGPGFLHHDVYVQIDDSEFEEERIVLASYLGCAPEHGEIVKRLEELHTFFGSEWPWNKK